MHHPYRFGASERVYRLEFVSNSKFTEQEFFKWKEAIMVSASFLPTVEDVRKKVSGLSPLKLQSSTSVILIIVCLVSPVASNMGCSCLHHQHAVRFL